MKDLASGYFHDQRLHRRVLKIPGALPKICRCDLNEGIRKRSTDSYTLLNTEDNSEYDGN